VAPRPARSVEYDAARAPAPANAEADPQERGRDLGVGRGCRAVQEPPLVLPLRDGVRAVGVRSAGRRSPRVLAEQQQIPPHSPARRGPLLDAFGRAATRRLGLLVPQREQLRGPGRELRGAVAPALRRGGRRAVLRSEERRVGKEGWAAGWSRRLTI